MNLIVLNGRLGTDPEIRFAETDEGKRKVVTLHIAHNDYIKAPLARDADENGYIKKTVWIKVTTWKERLIKIADTLQTGDEIIVEGYLTQKNWETPTGETRKDYFISPRNIWVGNRKGSANYYPDNEEDIPF